jgi:hypothetical protein
MGMVTRRAKGRIALRQFFIHNPITGTQGRSVTIAPEFFSQGLQLRRR